MIQYLIPPIFRSQLINMDVQGINLLWPRFLSFMKNHIDDMIWTISYDTFWPKGGQKHDGHWSLFVWNVSLHSNHCIQAVSTNLKSLSKRFKIIIHGRFNNDRVPAYGMQHTVCYMTAINVCTWHLGRTRTKMHFSDRARPAPWKIEKFGTNLDQVVQNRAVREPLIRPIKLENSWKIRT